MFLKRVKISQKVFFMIALSLLVFFVFTLWTIVMGKLQLNTLEEIYSKEVVPLDDLRKIQLIFRELEYRMAGVSAGLVASIGSGEHLKISLKETDRLWAEVKGNITEAGLQQDKEKFEKGYNEFKKVADRLQTAYFNEDTAGLPGLIDEYLDSKPLIFKSIDKMAEAQENGVKGFYTAKQKVVSTVNKLVVVASFFLIAVFLFLGVTINRSITRPINNTVEMLRDVAEGKGDLTRRLTVASEDEIGTLATWFNKFIEGMQHMVRDIFDISRGVSAASEDIGKAAKLVSASANRQMDAMATTSASTEQLSASIKEIAGEITELSKFTEETSASSLESSAAVAEIAHHAEELDSRTDVTVSSLNEIVASVKETVASIEMLSHETEDVASTMLEMERTINEVSASSKEQAVVTETVKKNASELGVEAVRKTREGIRNISREVTLTTANVEKLGEMSRKIGKITEVIEDISDVTTLLSLNAAILAAQAKEHGKGFAIVAEEIKELAVRTAASTKEINQLVGMIQENVTEVQKSNERGMERVSEAEKLSKNAEDALVVIIGSSETSLGMAKRIERAIDEQLRGVKQVTQNMQKVSTMAEGIKKATGEQSLAHESIMAATETVKTFTQQIKRATAEQSAHSSSLSTLIADASGRMKAMTKATNEQKDSVASIVGAIATIMEESEKNVGLAAELAKMVQALESQGASLNKQVGNFRVGS